MNKDLDIDSLEIQKRNDFDESENEDTVRALKLIKSDIGEPGNLRMGRSANVHANMSREYNIGFNEFTTPVFLYPYNTSEFFMSCEREKFKEETMILSCLVKKSDIIDCKRILRLKALDNITEEDLIKAWDRLLDPTQSLLELVTVFPPKGLIITKRVFVLWQISM